MERHKIYSHIVKTNVPSLKMMQGPGASGYDSSQYDFPETSFAD